MESRIQYALAQSFSRRPGGRKRANGVHSGEEFREDVLLKLFEAYDIVEIDLTGSAGYSTGFLDESFGGLVQYLSLAELERRLRIRADDDPGAVDIAWRRIHEAAKEAKH